MIISRCVQDHKLNALIAGVEAKLSEEKDLEELTVRVLVLMSESLDPKLQITDVASFNNRDGNTYLRHDLLPAYSESDVKAIMVHEIGHAYRHHLGFPETRELLSLPSEWSLGLTKRDIEEIWAEYYTCKWGFESELVNERGKNKDESYLEALSSWRDQTNCFEQLGLWIRQDRAGMKKRKS